VSFAIPLVLPLGAVLLIAAVLGYRALQRRRGRAGLLRATTAMNVTAGRADSAGRADRPRRAALRRHVPYLLFAAAFAVLLLGLARPTATVPTVRASGTVILAMDVSNSMAATDVKPSRLAVAEQVATAFVRAQPSTVDVGVVAFGPNGLTTVQPTSDHQTVVSALGRLGIGGSTSLGQAILSSLGVVAGHTVSLPRTNDADGSAGQGQAAPSLDEGQAEITAPPTGIGYRADATIVLLSDGENTGGPDAQAAAQLAANAGVHIETIGVGTEQGSVISVDGYQVATALNAAELTALAQTTGGSYHSVADAAQVSGIASSIQLRTHLVSRPVELTGLAAGVALLLLTAGGLLMIRWHGRIV
jgi:Ca-activated chloride channel family protein